MLSPDNRVFVSGCFSLSRELRHAVDELHAFDEFAESLDRGDAVPALVPSLLTIFGTISQSSNNVFT